MFGHYPTDALLSLSVFGISLWMLLIFRTNIIMTIFSLELLLLSNILGFTLSAAYLNDIVGEIFGLYILVIAAVETAIALCIILSYYRITNHHINITGESGAAFLSALILTIGNTQYTVFTLYYFFFTVLGIILLYLCTIGIFVDMIPGAIWYYYNKEKIFVRYDNVVSWYLRMRWPQYLYLIRTPKPNKIVDAKLEEYVQLGLRLQEREYRFWGAVWSVCTLEFLPKRFNYLTELYYKKFGFPDWQFIGYKYWRYEVRHESWYLRFIAKYTLVGQRFLEKREHHFELERVKKAHLAECKKFEDEIEKLQDIIKVKDAYIEMYTRRF